MSKKLAHIRALGIIGLLALAAVLCSTIVTPWVTSPTGNTNTTQGILNQANMLAHRSATITAQTKDVSANAAEVAELNTKIPADAQIPQLQIMIWGLAETVGIPKNAAAIQTYTSLVTPRAASMTVPAPTVPTGPNNTVYQTTITIVATGTLDHLHGFLAGLPNIPRLLTLGQVTLVSTGGGFYTATITATGYVIAPVATIPLTVTVTKK